MWSLMKPKRRHVVALMLVLTLLLGALYVATVNSEDYQEVERFVASDERVAAAIGAVQKVGFNFWDGFEFVGGSGGRANYSFNAITGSYPKSPESDR